MFRCCYSQRQQRVYYIFASWRPCHAQNEIRLFPLCGVKVLHPAQKIQLDRQLWPTQKQRTDRRTKRYPGCLVHLVSDMLYCVIATRFQPNLYIVQNGGRLVGLPSGLAVAFIDMRSASALKPRTIVDIGWVDVDWQRPCETRQSQRELP